MLGASLKVRIITVMSPAMPGAALEETFKAGASGMSRSWLWPAAESTGALDLDVAEARILEKLRHRLR